MKQFFAWLFQTAPQPACPRCRSTVLWSTQHAARPTTVECLECGHSWSKVE